MNKRYFVIALVILIATTVLATAAANGIGDVVGSSSLTATSTADPSPDGNSSPASTTVVPPGSVPPAWVVQGPVRTDAVLHWAESNSVTGQPTTVTDIWIELDGNGVIKRLHAYATESDGTFYQENGYASGEAYTVWSPGTQLIHPDSACVDVGSSPPPPAPPGPPFVADATTLKVFGIHQIPAVSAAVPITAQLAGIKPHQTFSTDEPWTTWESSSEPPNGQTQNFRFSVGAEQRVVHSSLINIGKDGSIIQQREVAYGRLDVYDLGTVPDSVFAKVSPVEEPCYVPH